VHKCIQIAFAIKFIFSVQGLVNFWSKLAGAHVELVFSNTTEISWEIHSAGVLYNESDFLPCRDWESSRNS